MRPRDIDAALVYTTMRLHGVSGEPVEQLWALVLDAYAAHPASWISHLSADAFYGRQRMRTSEHGEYALTMHREAMVRKKGHTTAAWTHVAGRQVETTDEQSVLAASEWWSEHSEAVATHNEQTRDEHIEVLLRSWTTAAERIAEQTALAHAEAELDLAYPTTAAISAASFAELLSEHAPVT